MVWPMLLTSCVACILVWLVVRLWRRPRNVPPGSRLPPMPPASSIFGHVEIHTKHFHCTKALEWAREYGPVYRLRAHCRELVVLNDADSIKKFANRNELLDHADVTQLGAMQNPGLGALNGAEWRENRRLCMKILRDSGFAKTSHETHMMEEFSELAYRIDEANGSPVFVFPYVLSSASCNIATFFYSSKKLDQNAWRKDVICFLRKLLAAVEKRGPFQFLPHPIKLLLQYVPFTAASKIRNTMKWFDDIITPKYLVLLLCMALVAYTCAIMIGRPHFVKTKNNEAHQPTGCKEPGEDFIEAYKRRIEEAKHDARPLFRERFLTGIINGFVMAGSLTTAITTTLHLVNFAANRDTLQARVQKEIDEVIGAHRHPTWEDRKKMPFTLACIWEMDRWKTVTPLGAPRLATDDIVVDGFFIPRNTVVILNLWAANHDPTYWKEPEVFNPSRYLKEDGSIREQKPLELVPFSYGRRSCPGEMYASIEIFLLTTVLLQRYDVHLDGHLKADLNDPKADITQLVQTKLYFVPRHVNKNN